MLKYKYTYGGSTTVFEATNEGFATVRTVGAACLSLITNSASYGNKHETGGNKRNKTNWKRKRKQIVTR